MKNLLREKIMNGEKTVGTFFEAGNASVAEALALTDLDYMLIDTEHGPFDVESVMLMLRGAELHGTTALVRVKDSNRNSILKMLDIGAGGLIIPQVHSLEEIKKIVEYGNRAELIEKKGMFYKMQNDYQSSVGWKVSNETEESRND